MVILGLSLYVHCTRNVPVHFAGNLAALFRNTGSLSAPGFQWGLSPLPSLLISGVERIGVTPNVSPLD